MPPSRPFRPHCRAVFASAWLLPLLAAPAVAETGSPLIPQEQLCPAVPITIKDAGDSNTPAPSGTNPAADAYNVSTTALITSLLSINTVRDTALDANGDGNTLIDEKIQALTNGDYCRSVSKGCSAEDETALAKARATLQAFAAEDGGPGYTIRHRDQPNQDAAAAKPTVTPSDLLLDDGRTLQIFCVALPATPVEQDVAEEGYWHLDKGDKTGFRLVGDISDLSKGRQSLGSIKPAQLSITGDLIEDETDYKVEIVTGYAFDITGGSEIDSSLIPFLEAQRVTSGDEIEIDTLGAGFQVASTVDWPGSLRSVFSVSPVYQTDSDFESEIGTLKFSWTPTLAKGAALPLGFPRVYGPVEVSFGLDFLADAGRVFDEGDQDNLDGEGTFLRFGNTASMQLRGAESTLIRPFELHIANRYLYNVGAQFDNINQFDAALAYIFPQNENYLISVAYSNGRDENSLELYEYWQTQFGIKF